VTPVEYDLYAFAGRVEFVIRVADRFTAATAAAGTYARNWAQVPAFVSPKKDTVFRSPPASLVEMIRGAETIAGGFPFLRVDFYEIDGRPRFAEVAFYPASGGLPFDPPEYDAIFGSYWPPGLPTV
jgi:hypothetical protein